MIPKSQPKNRKNSSKVNLVISAVFHGVLVVVLFYFATREGFFGDKMSKIAVEMIKEKKPEPPKPEPPKPEPPKLVETPKIIAPPAETAKAPPPAAVPITAPPPSATPDLFFNDGAKAVNTENDPVALYQGYMQYVLQSKWNRPDNMADDNFVAEVQINVNQQGRLTQTKWLKGSGDARWDQTVKDVFKVVTAINRPPPSNFPPVVTIRFDVASEETQPLTIP